MPRKSKKEVVEEPVVIEKPKRGRKKKVVPVATEEPVEESTPAPVPKKRVRKSKKVKVSEEPPVVIEEVKVDEVKPKKKPKALKVEKASEPKPKRAPSKWMLHVAEFRKANEGMSYRDALKKAKETYQK